MNPREKIKEIGRKRQQTYFRYFSIKIEIKREKKNTFKPFLQQGLVTMFNRD